LAPFPDAGAPSFDRLASTDVTPPPPSLIVASYSVEASA
jgi:hypothetical protein